MRYSEIKSLKECTTSSAVATSMGSGAGFGKSIFMKREVDEASPKRKPKKSKR